MARIYLILSIFLIFGFSPSSKATEYDLTAPFTMTGPSPLGPEPILYEYIVEKIGEGDTIKFVHEGKTVIFHIKANIGHGNETNNFLLTNGKILRINFRAYGEYLESFLDGQRAFKEAGVSVVKIYEDESHITSNPMLGPSYLVMEFLNFKPNGVEFTLKKFLSLIKDELDKGRLQKMGLTVQQAQVILEKLKIFVRTLAQFSEAEDFTDTNIAFVSFILQVCQRKLIYLLRGHKRLFSTKAFRKNSMTAKYIRCLGRSSCWSVLDNSPKLWDAKLWVYFRI
jgi:hypothetical protein